MSNFQSGFWRVPSALLLALLLTGCGYMAARDLDGQQTELPADFSFLDDKTPCYLELREGDRGLRMNCFHINGELYIHSSRWARLPRLSGESWTVTVLREPNVRVQIAERIYRVRAVRIDDENRRQEILYDRGYWYAWDAISVYRFVARHEDCGHGDCVEVQGE